MVYALLRPSLILIDLDILQTVDYLDEDQGVVLRISKTEKPRCVLQVGSCSPENLVDVCKKFSGDVAAIDVNMGCKFFFTLFSLFVGPKSFSVSGNIFIVIADSIQMHNRRNGCRPSL